MSMIDSRQFDPDFSRYLGKVLGLLLSNHLCREEIFARKHIASDIAF
jgi:hypothetical protein